MDSVFYFAVHRYNIEKILKKKTFVNGNIWFFFCRIEKFSAIKKNVNIEINNFPFFAAALI